jgi:hypothetical protein
MSEPKPTTPGIYLGQSSPLGEWEWDGTGTPNDAWIPVPTPFAAPNLAKSHVQTLATMDFANAAKFNLPAPPAGLTWVYMGQCWAKHDIIRVNGLT